MLARNYKKYYRTILAFVVCSQSLLVVSLQSEQTRGGRDNVVLSQRDARLVERALNYLVRAPRPDMPDESDPSFPIVDLGLDDIRRVLCTIREQNKKICGKVEDLQEELSIHDMLMEFDHENICSKLEILQENDETICSKLEEIADATFTCDTTTIQEILGDLCDTAHAFGSCVDKICVDHSGGSIVRWLKTILWELRGTFPPGTCVQPGETCTLMPPDCDGC